MHTSKVVKIIRPLVMASAVLACFYLGLYGGPAVKNAYASFFPEPEFTTGNYSEIHRMADSQIVLFSTSTCPYCKKTRTLLDKLGLPYKDYMTDKSAEAAAEFKTLGGTAVPLLFIGDRKIRGFRETTIRDAIALLGGAKQNQG